MAFQNRSDPTNFQASKENNIEQKFCPVGDHRGCGLVEQTIQTIKRRLDVMLLEENKRSIKLCLKTKIRDLRWNKQKTIQVSPFPFHAHFGRLLKNEIKILRDKFITNSDYLDGVTAQTEDRSIQWEPENRKKKESSAETPARCTNSNSAKKGTARERKHSRSCRRRTIGGKRSVGMQRRTKFKELWTQLDNQTLSSDERWFTLRRRDSQRIK